MSLPEVSAGLSAALAGRYTLERELGRGGMATVWLARDLRHERDVAIKVLHPDLAATLGPERFEREIRLVARLQHPHILPLLDSGRVPAIAGADGALWYAMPYVRGESLRARLDRDGRLPVAEAARILSEVADALAYAHEQGFVHRDVKPENVLLSGAHAVVADFGIAKALNETAPGRGGTTAVGLAIGTPAYMAPEQATGESTLDHRADIYALGIVGYELLTGRPPFAGRSAQATLVAQAVERPASLAEGRPEVPPRLAAIIERCLAKAPAERPQSAAVVSEGMRAFATPPAGTVAVAPAGTGSRHRAPLIVAGVLLLALLLGGVAYWRADFPASPSAPPDSSPASVPDAARSVAVLPLVNVGGDSSQEYFADGMTDELTSALSRVPGLRVASRTSAFVFKGRRDVDVREIGRKLNVDAVLEGSVRRAGDRLKVSTQLTNVRDGLTLWSDSYERSMADVFQVQDDIGRAIVTALQGRLGTTRLAAITPAHPRSLEAYDLFLRAQYHRNKLTEPDLRRSLVLFQAALAKDSTLVPAWAGISEAWAWLADDWVAPREAYPRAKAAALHAVAVDSTSGKARGALGIALMAGDWDFAAAEAAFRRAGALEPSYEGRFYDLADLFAFTGRLDSAIAAAREHKRRDPVSPQAVTRLGDMLLYAGRYDEALTEYREALELEPDFATALIGTSWTLTAQRRPEEAIRVLRRSPEMGVRARTALARAYAAMGQRADAERIAHDLESERTRHYVRAEAIASIYTALGDRERAFRWLDRALAERSAGLMYVHLEPWSAPLRSDPRFAAILRKVGVS